jgi:hypothetical protein
VAPSGRRHDRCRQSVGGRIVVILYRGLSFPSLTVDRYVQAIRGEGLLADAGTWRMIFPDLKPKLKDLLGRTKLERSDVHTGEATPPWVCACARRNDALYYACRHNRSRENDASVVITFEAPERDIIVDGRDFLYPVFQSGVPELAGPALASVFGSAILAYADRAWSTDDRRLRALYCDLAIQDDEVIAAHAKNGIVLGGKASTVFSSAFMTRAPISPANIQAVEIVRCEDYSPAEIELPFQELTTASGHKSLGASFPLGRTENMI